MKDIDVAHTPLGLIGRKPVPFRWTPLGHHVPELRLKMVPTPNGGWVPTSILFRPGLDKVVKTSTGTTVTFKAGK